MHTLIEQVPCSLDGNAQVSAGMNTFEDSKKYFKIMNQCLFEVGNNMRAGFYGSVIAFQPFFCDAGLFKLFVEKVKVSITF